MTAPTTDPDVELEPTDDDDCDVPVETDQDLDRDYVSEALLFELATVGRAVRWLACRASLLSVHWAVRMAGLRVAGEFSCEGVKVPLDVGLECTLHRPDCQRSGPESTA